MALISNITVHTLSAACTLLRTLLEFHDLSVCAVGGVLSYLSCRSVPTTYAKKVLQRCTTYELML